MEIILLQHVESLGRRGDIVKVRPGFARNFLLPRGVAALATPGVKRRVEQESRKFKQADDRARGEATALAERVAALELSIAVKADEEGKLYGSVSPNDVHAAMHAAGVDIDKKRILLEHNLKDLGEHEVHIRLHPDVRGHLKVTVVRE